MAVSGWPFPQSLLHFFVPDFPLDRNISELKTLRWLCGPIHRQGSMPIYWRWSLQVLSPPYSSFLLMSSPLGPGSLPHPWCLGLSSGSPYPHPTLLHISIYSPGPRSFSFVFHPYLILPHLFPFPYPLPSRSLPPVIVLFPFLSKMGAPVLH